MASLLVSVTSKGVVTCMRKVGKGSLDPESIFEMMEVRLWGRGRGRAWPGVPAASCPLGWSHIGILPVRTLDSESEDSWCGWCELEVCHSAGLVAYLSSAPKLPQLQMPV